MKGSEQVNVRVSEWASVWKARKNKEKKERMDEWRKEERQPGQNWGREGLVYWFSEWESGRETEELSEWRGEERKAERKKKRTLDCVETYQ